VLHVAIDRGGGRRINGAGHGGNAPVMIDGATNDLENAKEIAFYARMLQQHQKTAQMLGRGARRAWGGGLAQWAGSVVGWLDHWVQVIGPSP
jgi:hypothetical protein